MASPGGEGRGPGAPEQRMRHQQLAEGVPLPDDRWASTLAAARQVGVGENRIQQATRASELSSQSSPWRPFP